METPSAKAGRLLTALEDLSGQEGTLLRATGFPDAGLLASLAGRADPLVHELGLLMADPLVEQWRPRVKALMVRRLVNSALLDAQVTRLQTDLRRIDEARSRIARVAPVYGGGLSAPAETRLNFAA
jgi:hypothetical protein